MTELTGVNRADGPAGAERTQPTALEADRLRLKKATLGFETIFATQLVRQMRRTVPENKIGTGLGQTMMRDLADDAFGEYLGRQGSFGLAEAMYRTLERHLGTDETAAAGANDRVRGSIPLNADRGTSNGIPIEVDSVSRLERTIRFIPRLATDGSNGRPE